MFVFHLFICLLNLFGQTRDMFLWNTKFGPEISEAFSLTSIKVSSSSVKYMPTSGGAAALPAGCLLYRRHLAVNNTISHDKTLRQWLFHLSRQTDSGWNQFHSSRLKRIEKEHKASLTHKHVTQRLNHTAQYLSKNVNFSGWGFSAAHKALWPLRSTSYLSRPKLGQVSSASNRLDMISREMFVH